MKSDKLKLGMTREEVRECGYGEPFDVDNGVIFETWTYKDEDINRLWFQGGRLRRWANYDNTIDVFEEKEV